MPPRPLAQPGLLAAGDTRATTARQVSASRSVLPAQQSSSSLISAVVKKPRLGAEAPSESHMYPRAANRINICTCVWLHAFTPRAPHAVP
jgi:hypothetical protein